MLDLYDYKIMNIARDNKRFSRLETNFCMGKFNEMI